MGIKKRTKKSNNKQMQELHQNKKNMRLEISKCKNKTKRRELQIKRNSILTRMHQLLKDEKQTLVQAPYTLPTYTSHTTATKTQTHVQHSPCSHRIGKVQPIPLIHSPPLHPRRPEPNTYTSHILHQPLTSPAPHSSKTCQLH